VYTGIYVFQFLFKECGKIRAGQTSVWGQAELSPHGTNPVIIMQEKLPFSLCGIYPDFPVHITAAQATVQLIDKCGY